MRYHRCGRLEKAKPSAVHRYQESRDSHADTVKRGRMTGRLVDVAAAAAVVGAVGAQEPGDERGQQHFSERAPDHEARRVFVREDVSLGGEGQGKRGRGG